jgi:hypothetical protein
MTPEGGAPWYVRAMSKGLLLAATLALGACGGAQSEDARFKSALGQAPPMVHPVLSGVADPAVSSSWDSTYRMLTFSSAEACFLAEWDVPAHLAPAVQFRLEGWRSLDEDRGRVAYVRSRSVEVLDQEVVAQIKAKDPPPRADDIPPEIRALKPRLTPMRVCFPPGVIRSATRYLIIWLQVVDDGGRGHETGAGWRLVPPRAAAAR